LRKTAIRSLGRSKDPEVLKFLEKLLLSLSIEPWWRVRLFRSGARNRCRFRRVHRRDLQRGLRQLRRHGRQRLRGRHPHRRDELRALRATARLVTERHQDGPENRVAERLDARARIARLAAALAVLSPDDREVLLLTSWAGLSPVEIAQALDIPAGTVRSRLHRVRRWLRASATTIEPAPALPEDHHE